MRYGYLVLVCVAVGLSTLAGEAGPPGPQIQLSLLNEEPILPGEVLKLKMTFRNDGEQPFRFLLTGPPGIKEKAPPSVLLIIKDLAGQEPDRVKNASVAEACYHENSVKELSRGECAEWKAFVPFNELPDLAPGKEYELVGVYRRRWSGPDPLRLWTGEIVSNPIRITPSAEPVMFSWKSRMTYKRRSSLIYILDHVLFLQAGWLVLRTEHPDTGRKASLRKILKVGEVEPVMVANGAPGELHLLLQQRDRMRLYVHVGSDGELLRKEAVPATATLLKREDGEVALVEVHGPGPVETPSSGAAGGRD